MIGSIKGKLLAKHSPQVLVEVSGISYEIELSTATFVAQPELGSEIFLYPHFQVRADAPNLFAFSACDALVKIPGVGKKTADRLVIEMRDRLITSEDGMIESIDITEKNNAKSEAFDALIALGYKTAQVKKLMSSVKGDDLTASDIIRQALKRAND